MKKFPGNIIIVFILCYNIVYAGSEQKIEAITNPCADVTLSFVQPGSIAKINYKEGDIVLVDNVLIQQEDSVEQLRLEQLKAESEDETTIKHAEITLEQREIDLKRLEERPAITTETEIEYAKLNRDIAKLQQFIANFQHTQAKKKYEEAKKQIDRMSLKSPIDGIIETIHKEKGESVNALEDVIRIVRIDPLWIDVAVPMAQTANLRNGGKVIVEFPEPKKITEEGRIIFISSVGHAGSGKLIVRVQVPNKTSRPARENVIVSFQTN
ncbi:MAG: efflux RND transporter periplasmic adaptor subunit [Sedimentisphaerales bacterium]|nr:efflux RND transporter periplasmic adaptor subunit [Sedimentisphaerales bacterium]